MSKRLWGYAWALITAAFALLRPKMCALPRVVKFSQHPFVKRGHAKVLAGGASPSLRTIAAFAAALLRRAAPAFAVVALLLFCASCGTAAEGGAMLFVGRTAAEELKALIEGQGRDFESRMRELENMVARGAFSPGSEHLPSAELREHASAFQAFIRRGEDAGLRDLEIRAGLSTDKGTDGGFAVTSRIDNDIETLIAEATPALDLCNVVTPIGGHWRKLVNLRGTSSGWAGERQQRQNTETPEFAAIDPPGGDLYAYPLATQWMIDDVHYDVEAFLAEEIGTEFGVQIGAAFVSGDGINKLRGFLSRDIVSTADATRETGKLQYVPTGAAADFATFDAQTGVSPLDVFIDAIAAMKPGYRKGASWLMNTTTAARVRKFKDADGAFVWQPSAAAGQPDRLLGYPVQEVPDMPDVGANAFPVAFGNWKRGYTIVDRVTRMLRDPFSNKPHIGFYATRRMNGDVINAEAIKLIKCAVA